MLVQRVRNRRLLHHRLGVIIPQELVLENFRGVNAFIIGNVEVDRAQGLESVGETEQRTASPG